MKLVSIFLLIGSLHKEGKMPELDLEKLADEIIRVEYPTYEQAIPGLREAIIRKKRKIKRVLERHIKQTEAGAEKKKVMEGYLICIPYVGDAWILLKDRNLVKEYCEINKKKFDRRVTIKELDRQCEIEEDGEYIDSVLCDLEGKKVRITVEVVGEDVFNNGS